MKVVKSHIEDLFKDLPNSKKVQDVKENMLETVEDKYDDLLNQGADAESATATIINDLDSIDEVKAAIGLGDLQKDYDSFLETYDYKMTLYALGMIILPIILFVLLFIILHFIFSFGESIFLPLFLLSGSVAIYFVIKLIKLDAIDEKYKKLLMTKQEENLTLIRNIIIAIAIFFIIVLYTLGTPGGITISTIPLAVGIYYYIKLKKKTNNQ